jgi:hypothetical protein
MTGKHWPDTVKPASVLFYPELPSASGGPALGGSEQVVFSSAGRWHAKLTMSVRLKREPVVNSRERVLSARAIVAYLKGRSNIVYMPVFDSYSAPSPAAGGTQGLVKGIPHSDGTLFSDGTGYAQFSSPATLAATAAKGSLAATVDLLASTQTVYAGQYFGLGDCELYLIDSVVDNGAGNFSLTFWPPLRSTHVVGATVNFDTPTCAMRLAADDSALLNFTPAFVADQEIELVEAL